MWRGGEDRERCLTDCKALVGLVTPAPLLPFDGLPPQADPPQADVPSSTARAASKLACAKTSLIGNGIGNLKEVCEGASPRSLAEPRDDSYTKVTPRRICDRVRGRSPGLAYRRRLHFDRMSGPRSGLYEDFIEREIGNLKEVCEGASPRSLAEPRDDSYTKVTPRRICDSSG